MPGPYNPPNPYGSYFNFGDVQGAQISSFMPYSSGNLSPGTQNLMGRGTGGFNPSPSEYMAHRVQNEQMARFMSDVYRGDPRTAAFTNMAMQAMWSSDSARRKGVDKIGGVGNLQEIIGFMLSQPGISGALGGSAASLGIGSYALASSGLGINGRIMTGDGPLQQQMARSIYSQIQSKFYGPAGAANTAMTNGLDRDQIGGLMTLMASQGAFKGLNMGELTQKAGKLSFNTNPGALNQITESLKNGAKALGAIMDVYGDASVGQLFAKAQQITGLRFSTPGNAQLMSQRLSELRNVGLQTGIDTQTMFDTAKMGGDMGRSLGLTGYMAGYAGHSAALFSARGSLAAASGRSILNGGFIVGQQELAGARARDIAGMAFDPIGMRQGLMTMLLDQGAIGDPGARKEVEAMMATAGPGGANANQLDKMMRKHGFNMPDLIRQFGGGEGIMRNLSTSQTDKAGALFEGGMQGRIKHIIASKMVAASFGGAAGSAMTLIENLESDTIGSLLSASSGKDGNDALNALASNSATFRKDPVGYANAARAVAAHFGSPEAARVQMQVTDQVIRTNPFTKTFESVEAHRNSMISQLSKRPMITSDEHRGFMRSGLIDGMLERYGGTDDRTAFTRVMIANPRAVAGGRFGLALPGLDEEWGPDTAPKMARLVNDFQRQFSGSQAGRDVLKELELTDKHGNLTALNNVDLGKFHRSLTDPEQRRHLFRAMTEIRIRGTGGGEVSTFSPTSAMENAKTFGGAVSVAQMVVNKMNQAGPSRTADLLQAAGLALQDDQHRLYEVRDGVRGKFIRTLGATELQPTADLISRTTTALDIMKKTGATDVMAMAKMNRQYGKSAMEMLSFSEQNLIGKAGSEDDLTFIHDTMEKLKGQGFAVPKSGQVTKIMGTLKLGDKELELVADAISDGKK